jgi:hypothetical protein
MGKNENMRKSYSMMKSKMKIKMNFLSGKFCDFEENFK